MGLSKRDLVVGFAGRGQELIGSGEGAMRRVSGCYPPARGPYRPANTGERCVGRFVSALLKNCDTNEGLA